ncbi:outer membrane beta-barrel protein [Thermoflexibacter ruber]|uniref:Outer membrane protein beta-barrel domain-containing protein n=1 Tax=Thermoflexibacter ruber TaxID=1003 RepID=A0A1I2EL86_9BACT|nr:outer membrane beta-barrel protein [Thermoflexibacter ruber]SFE93377.1 Outer membrane protein beta-barrel domain-containing protein [Thermoflexibacter ruber]
MRYLLLLLLLSLMIQTSFAQDTDSKITLLNNKYKTIANNLEKLYQNGELEEVISLFRKSCLEKDEDLARESKDFRKVKKEFQADIYSIVCRAYIALDKPNLADRFLSKLFAIRVDEDFQEYWLAIRESKSYDYYIAPRLQIGGVIGSNLSFAMPTERFSIFNNMQLGNSISSEKKYFNSFEENNLIGFRLGFLLTYALTKNFALLIQPSYSNYRFAYRDFYGWADNPAPNLSLLLDLEKNSIQSINYIEIPAVMRYQFLIDKKFKPYLLLGAFNGLLSNASKTLVIKELPGIRINGEKTDFFGNTASARYDVTNLLSSHYYGLVIGTGMGYHFQNFRFSFSATYRYGLNNIVNPAQRYTNQDLVFGYHDIFDNMLLNSLSLQLSISYVLTHKAFRR